MPKDFALRRARGGRGLLPPNPKWWEHEHNGLDLRHELSLPLDQRLSHEAAFNLLPNTYVARHSELNLDAAIANYFSGARSSRWSGMCVPYPDGTVLVIYNGGHALNRIRATLMEEFFHLWLKHAPTILRFLPNGDGGRDYDRAKESEAYGSGAAALVPYKPLRAMLEAGSTVASIARHFFVSEQLIEFRIKISKLSRLRRGYVHAR